MQAAAFAATGLRGWTYELLDVPGPDVPAAVEGLRADDVAGANVTIPHKLQAALLVDELDPTAGASGAVNTIVNRGGRLHGANTDVAGIRATLAALEVLVTPALRVLILGGGGSARAAAAAVAGARLVFAVRREVPDLPGAAIGWDERGELARDSDLLINCTPLGRAGEEALSEADLPLGGAVLDLVYVVGGTPLVRAARRRGLRTGDGWEVLLEQGAASFTAWTGLPAPKNEMRETLPA